MLQFLPISLSVAFVLACAPSEPISSPPSDVEKTADAADPAAASVATTNARSAADLAWLPAGVAAHRAAIDAAAARHGVDPRLVAIIVSVESNGRVDAISPAGARGLMQIMPRTADAIASTHGLPAPTEQTLLDRDTNLELGVLHLADLIADLGDTSLDEASVQRVATAYNGGAKVVLEERTPSAETARYAARVVSLWRARDQAAAPN